MFFKYTTNLNTPKKTLSICPAFNAGFTVLTFTGDCFEMHI